MAQKGEGKIRKRMGRKEGRKEGTGIRRERERSGK